MSGSSEKEREIPEPMETDTRREPGMGDPGTMPSEGHAADAGATDHRGAGASTDETTDTRRATGMGEPGTLPSDRPGLAKARDAAGGRLEEVAGRVRDMGDQAASRNKLLEPTRSLAYNAAENIDHAAEYVRNRPVDEVRSDLERTVRRHPLTSVAVAFFAGYTLRRIF
jgi:hypothetical protein